MDMSPLPVKIHLLTIYIYNSQWYLYAARRYWSLPILQVYTWIMKYTLPPSPSLPSPTVLQLPPPCHSPPSPLPLSSAPCPTSPPPSFFSLFHPHPQQLTKKETKKINNVVAPSELQWYVVFRYPATLSIVANVTETLTNKNLSATADCQLTNEELEGKITGPDTFKSLLPYHGMVGSSCSVSSA